MDNLHNYYQTIFQEKINTLKTAGNYRYFLDIERSAALFPVFFYTDTAGNRKTAINFCSNDYLGQTTHPAVIEAAQTAIAQAGTGSGGTRNISGTTIWHKRLETSVAQLVGKESALIFNSAYLANQTALTTLGRHFSDGILISDAENHASMIEGLRASRCEKRVFRHNDLQHLEAILASFPLEMPKIVAFESVYSMSGTVAPISEIVKLAKQYNALTYCDEVHAVGLYGKNGAGLVAETQNTEGVDILNGTFAKAFGVIGGFLAGSAAAMDFIRSYAEGFIFTSSLPPATCAAVIESIEVLKKEPQIVQKFKENVRFFRQKLTEKKIDFEGKDAHITRIVIGDSMLCKSLSDSLLRDYGIYIQPINFPTVPRGEECLRIIITAKHSNEQIMQLVESLYALLNIEK